MSGRLLCELGDTIYRQAKPKSGCEHAVTAQFFGASVESSLAPVQRQAVQAHTGCITTFFGMSCMHVVGGTKGSRSRV